MSAAQPPQHRTFHWTEASEFLREVPGLDASELVCARSGGGFVGGGWRCLPPLAAALPAEDERLSAYLERLPDALGLQFVVLLQAGASSLGAFEDEEELATKSFRRYVVRGNGRAQPTHLDKKGKSRYGSRLRLQNARRLLEETNEKLHEWVEEFGVPERVFHSAPVRLWPSLFEAEPAPPFEREHSVRIPRDLPKPTSALLQRAYRSLCYGRLERDESAGEHERT